MKSMRFELSMAGLALLGLTAAAHAGDVKVFPGAMCHPIAGSDFSSFSMIAESIGNISAGVDAKPVVCPIVRDKHAKKTGLKGVLVRAKSLAGRTLSCTLMSYGPTGAIIEGDTAMTTSSTAVSLALDVEASEEGGYYVVSCSLPPGARLYSYLVDE